MIKSPARRPIAEPPIDYLELVRRFPLRPLSSRRELAAAGAILDQYVGREDLTPGQRDYIAALARFVADYEQQHHLAKLLAIDANRASRAPDARK